MAKKQANDYFEMFANMADYSCQAAESLRETLLDFKPSTLPQKMEQIHAIEHAADGQKHELMRQLVKEFLPPIERNDIMTLSSCLDDVTDAVEDVLMKIYMYNILSIRNDALEFSEIILQCCKALRKAVEEFKNFKKSSSIHGLLVDINRLEEVGDRLYTKAVHELFSEGGDPVKVLAWTETYRRFELCCDACEKAADVIESVIMQNS